jgi:hypothetical protein
MKRFAALVVVLVAGVAAVLAFVALTGDDGGDDTEAAAATPAPEAQDRLPLVFVHGFSGSGAQFETQAMRFTSNGYPAGIIAVHEYDSLFSTEERDDVYTRLDERIDSLLEASGADQVDLLAHSLGTDMMQEYLNSSEERAASVAHYVNLDGQDATAPPGGVPTLAVWGRGPTSRAITGATNVYFANQTHTQVVTSPETFEQVYTFLTGEEPATTEVLPENSETIELAGRAMIFPQNTGVTEASLEVYEVNGATGHRVDDEPEASFPLGGDGDWGPFDARRGRNYEFALVGETATHHIYFEPFERSDRWVRLLTQPPTGGIVGDLIERSDGHASIVIARYQEWWGDQGAGSDVLTIDGVNVLNAQNSSIDKRAIAVFMFDAGSDGATDLATPIPSLFALPFLTAVDIDMPASPGGAGTISIASTPRLGGGRTVVVNVPDWPSSTDPISVHFNEYVPSR